MQPSSQKGPGTALECETSKERRQAAPKLDPLGWRCGSGDVTNLRWKEVKRSERVRSKEVEVAEAATTSKMVSWCIGPTTLKHAGRSTSWGLGITHLSFELFPSPFCATAVERGFATAFDMQTDSLGHQRRQKECSLDQSGTASILTSYLSTWPSRKQAFTTCQMLQTQAHGCWPRPIASGPTKDLNFRKSLQSPYILEQRPIPADCLARGAAPCLARCQLYRRYIQNRLNINQWSSENAFSSWLHSRLVFSLLDLEPQARPHRIYNCSLDLLDLLVFTNVHNE